MLGIKDKYLAFCIDEAAAYTYNKLIETQGKPAENDGNKLLRRLAKYKRKK